MLLTSFKDFIVENEARGSDLGRVIAAIEKKMPSALGTKMYRYGGKDGVITLPSNTQAYLYFFGASKAFQIRIKGHVIVGFDIWKRYSISKGPSFTIDTKGLSPLTIAKELKKIAAIIKAPKEETIEFNNVVESITFETSAELFEAKSVSSDEFLKLAQKELSDDTIKDITFDAIVKIARDNNVAVPSKEYLAKQKVGRGRWTLFPNNSAPTKKADDKMVSGKSATGSSFAAQPTDPNAPILYIKVTAQDPKTKKFLPTADNEAAQALYKQIQDTIESPPTKEEIKDPATMYGHLNILVEQTCKGKLRSLLVYGGPGTGKTHTIMEVVAKQGLVKGKDYVKLSGKATPQAIYETLFMFRKKGLVIFDDLDSMWRDKDAANYLKAALDSSPVREISSVSTRMINVSKMSDEKRDELNTLIDRRLKDELEPDIVSKADAAEDDEEDADIETVGSQIVLKPGKVKFPSTFNFSGQVIFISNLKKNEFDSAIMSRSVKIDMSMTTEQILLRMKSILPNLGGSDVDIKVKEELLEFLVNMHKNNEITMLTMREFEKGMNIVRSGVPNWKDLIQYVVD